MHVMLKLIWSRKGSDHHLPGKKGWVQSFRARFAGSEKAQLGQVKLTTRIYALQMGPFASVLAAGGKKETWKEHEPTPNAADVVLSIL